MIVFFPLKTQLLIINYAQCFRHNHLDSVPKDVLKSFPNLKTLFLQKNSIAQIRRDDFRYNTKLEVENFKPYDDYM